MRDTESSRPQAGPALLSLPFVALILLTALLLTTLVVVLLVAAATGTPHVEHLTQANHVAHIAPSAVHSLLANGGSHPTCSGGTGGSCYSSSFV